MLRGFVLVLLGLAVAGFGVCSLCGGVMGIASVLEGGSSRSFGEAALFMSAIGAAITVLCFWGFRAVRRGGRAAQDEPPQWPPAPPAPPPAGAA